MTDPLVYAPAGNPQKDINYLEYTDAYSLAESINLLIDDVDRIHEIENANFEYYNNYVRPDSRILNTLKIAFPEYFKAIPHTSNVRYCLSYFISYFSFTTM